MFTVLDEDSVNSTSHSSSHLIHNSPPASSGNLPEDSHARVKKHTHSNTSPLNVMESIFIPDKTTTLLIGDSVIRLINPRRLMPQLQSVYKLCVPGMSIADLTTWLHSRPPCPKVKHLFLHVGLNSCSSGQISVNTWTKLIILCKKVFPSSTLALSSIIPAKGRHNLNNAIAPSNSNLHKACQLLDVAIIDNTSSFVAPSGAPRLALYRDPFHPSVQGTAKLFVSMKKMLANWQPDHFWRSDPGRYDRRNWP
ncbi:hypothetical protein ACOMHN_039647 [Nucella lapillus]